MELSIAASSRDCTASWYSALQNSCKMNQTKIGVKKSLALVVVLLIGGYFLFFGDPRQMVHNTEPAIEISADGLDSIAELVENLSEAPGVLAKFTQDLAEMSKDDPYRIQRELETGREDWLTYVPEEMWPYIREVFSRFPGTDGLIRLNQVFRHALDDRHQKLEELLREEGLTDEEILDILSQLYQLTYANQTELEWQDDDDAVKDETFCSYVEQLVAFEDTSLPLHKKLRKIYPECFE